MKWPSSITLIRHGESEYNILREKKAKCVLYQKFKEAFEKDSESTETVELAKKVQDTFSLGVSDYNTALTEKGARQARETGRNLFSLIHRPDFIFVSPYLRARQTFYQISQEWPDLVKAELSFDDRIREQEHGLSLLYNDWRVFHTFHPEQKKFHDLMGSYWYQYPQGESVSQVRDRSRHFASMLIRECAGKRVLLVTHHLTILSIRANLERLSPEDFTNLDEKEKPINCGVTTYNGISEKGSNGRLELEYYNKQLWT